MKTEEDEAFDELAKKQGDWGGGYQAKRKMAADKLQEDLINYGTSWSKDGERIDPMSVYLEEPAQDGKCKLCVDGCAACDDRAQPAQDEMLTIVYQSGYHDGKQAALAGREWNFCERCGKRTKDLTTIHTCTPPQEKNNA